MVTLMTVTLKTVFATVTKVFTFTLNMVPKKGKKTNMREDGPIILKMESELKLTQYLEDTKYIGKMEKDTVKVFLYMIIKTYTQDNGKTEKKMVKAPTFSKKQE